MPALAALATVPLVVAGLGEAGYGLYSLVTAIVGYFAVIDINVTAGSVKYIAAQHARAEHDSVAETLCFGFTVYLLIGTLGALGLYGAAPWLAAEVFAVPATLAGEAVSCLRLAALGFLLGQLQSYLNSVPQGLMRFDVSGRIEMVFGTLVPLLTVAVLMLGQGLYEVIALRVVASALHCLVLWRGVKRLLPRLRWRWPDRALRGSILGFSAYSFLSRFAALSYAHADKLVIGALVGVTGLAYFTVAATLANRVLGLTFRLSGVFFPATSALAAGGELARLGRAYLKATRYLVYVNAAMLVLLAVFAHPLLTARMGADFARSGALVLALMALSQFVDSLTSLPTLVNDGMGYPRLSGVFALARALVGLVLVYAGVAGWGIEGAAWGHLLASLLFTVSFLVVVHGRTVPTQLSHLCAHAYLPGIGAAAIAAVFAGAAERWFDRGSLDFALIALISAALLALLGMVFVVERDDRRWAWAWVKAMAGG
ncbi:oligosaccharide flippase family protein [Massilia sp. Se16.2.3]|uniref:oligosaccharide flippase family protein n=1 Tax=Massilia sp. Se16.2.3 TaxID=2709303 RepID=UPI001E370CC7|nr:oligosaccharide flippase family protein [Massilia sp. Se16.2.3]